MVNTYLVYGLIDPRSGELRYVGKSERGELRLREHSMPSRLHRDGNTRKANWLRQLLAAGLKPEVEVLEEHETAEALVEAEKHFIAYFRAVGCRLTNLTDGGDGVAGWRHTEEARAKMSATASARVLSPERRAQIAATLRRKSHRKLTPEEKNRLAIAHGARALLDESGNRYCSPSEAARVLGVWPQNINAVLRGRLKTTGGHSFRYAE